jgi:transcriptional regulator with XRE-family HTH domain
LTQQQLAETIGIGFKQIHKYECSANRVSVTRLHELSITLNVPVGYFFEGLQTQKPTTPANDRSLLDADILSQKETLELLRAYYKLDEGHRRQLLKLAKALQDDSAVDEAK